MMISLYVLWETLLNSKLVIHAAVSTHSALCLVIWDSIGGILGEKVHHTDKMYYNVFDTKFKNKKKQNQDIHTADSSQNSIYYSLF